MKIICSSEVYNLTIHQSSYGVYTDEYGFLEINVIDFCISVVPSRTVLPQCQNELTFQNILPHSLTVDSYRINDNCCRELEPPNREWDFIRVCTSITTHDTNNGRLYYQCVEKKSLPIQVYYDGAVLVSFSSSNCYATIFWA